MNALIVVVVLVIALAPLVVRFWWRWLRVDRIAREESTITVADAVWFAVGNRILIDQEYFVVTKIDGRTLTVRGVAGRCWRWQR